MISKDFILWLEKGMKIGRHYEKDEGTKNSKDSTFISIWHDIWLGWKSFGDRTFNEKLKKCYLTEADTKEDIWYFRAVLEMPVRYVRGKI